MPKTPVTFIDGIRTMTTAGDVQGQSGMAANVYVATADMVDEQFFNADGELLIVPEAGRLRVLTEMGIMDLEPSEICVIPRGMVFRVELPDGTARGSSMVAAWMPRWCARRCSISSYCRSSEK